MKQTGIFFTALFMCSFLWSINLQAQTSVHENRYIVWFDESATTQQAIDDFRDEMYSDEVWASSYSGVRIWEVNLPYTPPGEPTVTNINQHKERHDGSQVPGGNGGSGFDYYTPAPIILTNTSGGGGTPSGPGQNPGQFDVNMDCYGEISVYNNTGQNTYGTTIFDTGDNGIDDLPPYFFIPAVKSGFNYLSGIVDDNDDHGHGTHMMSIASHITNNANGSAGQSLTQTPFRMAKTFASGGFGYLAEIIQAFETEAINGMKIANFSFSWRDTPQNMQDHPMEYSIKAMRDNFGVLVIASAGNDDEDLNFSSLKNYPACFGINNMLSVASYGCGFGVSSYSNYGNQYIDVAAPGDDIPGLHHVTGLKVGSGTSQATAIVTGIATMLSTHQSTFDYQEIICAIKTSAVKNIGNISAYVDSGIVNAFEALQLLGGCVQRPIKNVGIQSSGNMVGGFTNVSPNPTTGFINLTINSVERGTTNIRLVNNLGQLFYNDVRNTFEGQNELNLDFSELPNGIYHMVVENGNQKSHEKIIITR